nr:MAG TPA: terminase small subunit [Caudoviricetes sp.]
MRAKSWKNLIQKQLSILGNEEKAYDSVIATLSDILEQRDIIYQQYQDEGCNPVREYTNKGGATNTTKNPLLVLWDDLNKSALAYWRELGLTPSSYKKMTGDTPKQKKESKLEQALKNLEP